MCEVIQIGDTLKVAVFHFLTRSYATRTNVLADSSGYWNQFRRPFCANRILYPWNIRIDSC